MTETADAILNPYTGDFRLWLIEECGEQMCYAAKHPWQAIKYHIKTVSYGEDLISGAEPIVISMFKPDKMICVAFEDEPTDFPEHWCLGKAERTGNWMVQATAAEWARVLEAHGNGVQLVFDTAGG